MTVHFLKTEKLYFKQVWAKVKPFELRKDDRTPGYRVGDHLVLREMVLRKILYGPSLIIYTGREVVCKVTNILNVREFIPCDIDAGNWVVMGLEEVNRCEDGMISERLKGVTIDTVKVTEKKEREETMNKLFTNHLEQAARKLQAVEDTEYLMKLSNDLLTLLILYTKRLQEVEEEVGIRVDEAEEMEKFEALKKSIGG